VTGRPHDIIIDGYLARVLGVLRARERQTRENATERIEIESSGRWRPVMTNPLEGKTDARWICAETMLGVVLGTGGSVLHVPQELVETDDSVRIAGNCMGGKLTDKLEGHGEAVGDDKGRDGAICQVRVQRELSKDVLSPSSPEVIVISESDDDDAQKGTVSYDQPFTATFLPLGIIDKEKISP
jgi:E3 SUMO-protein ligase PIAS1